MVTSHIDDRIGVWLLGSLEAGRVSAPSSVAGTRLQALLAGLALAVPHPVASERLIDEIWGDQGPANPANSLQAQVSQLRRVLGTDVVVRRGAGYALLVEPDDVDAVRLERLVRAGRDAAIGGDPHGAVRAFEAALSLVRGPPLADLVELRFAREAAARLGELVLAAHEGLVDAQLATGRHAEAVAPLADLVRGHPLRERFHAQLVLALYRCGRQAEALRAYQDARAILVEELGVDPGQELQELERAVLAHDPALMAPTPSPSPRPGPLAGVPPTEAVTTTEAAGTGGPLVPSMLPLVGRDAERQALRADLAEVTAGRGRMALLGGEPGIGKTRLAEELAAEAAGQGAVVVWGRCYDGRGAPAFWPWTQVVHGLLDHYPDDQLTAALGAGIADVAQIAPEVKELVDELEPLPPLDPESARFRLYQAVSGFVRRLAGARPLTIALDDLHWADESSLALLGFLAIDLAEAPLFVIGTYRNVDPLISGALSDTLVELARRPAVRRLELAGLDREGLARILSATGSEPSDELLATVHRRTDGNPFFVTEILRLLPSTGELDDSATRVVPASVKGVIRQRIARLPEGTVEVLAAASILGQDFDLTTLAALVDLDGATLLDRLDPAMAAGIVVDSPQGFGRSRFSHGLVSETVYQDLGAAQRARTHRRAAEALEAHHGDSVGPHLVGLAAHWAHAVPAAPPERGIDAALRAASWAQAHVAHHQAEELLRSALELLTGLADGRERAARELEVQDQLSNLLIITSGYTAPGLNQACARMRELCQAIEDPRLLLPALWRLSIFYLVSTELDTAVTLGEQILALAGPDDEPGALLAGHMALGVIRTHRGEIAPARRHFDAAMALSVAGHDTAVSAFVAETPAVWIRVFGAWNWWLLDEDDRARQWVDEALDIALAGGVETYAMTFAVWFASLLATLRRDAADGRRRSEEGIALAMAGGYGMCLPFLTAQLGWALAAEGDFEAGTVQLLAGDAALRASGAGIMRHVFPGFHADACLVNGRPAEALGWTERGLAEVDITGERWFEAELHRLRGEALAGLEPSDPVALDEFRRAAEIAEAQGAEVLRRRAHASLARRAADGPPPPSPNDP